MDQKAFDTVADLSGWADRAFIDAQSPEMTRGLHLKSSRPDTDLDHDHRLFHLPDSRAASGCNNLIRKTMRCETLPITEFLANR